MSRDIDITPNITVRETLEPEQYFEILKNDAASISDADIIAQANFIASELEKARRLGQKNFADWLEFSKATLIRERLVLASGFEQYVNREALSDKIEMVAPKNSVKIIELERYPRSIPDGPSGKIEAALAGKLFDGVMVVFTDLTGRTYQTPQEVKFLARNRDPIAFGYFKDAKSGQTHHRFYFIADWQDSQCELTFDKILNGIPKHEWGRLRSDEISAPESEERLTSWMKTLTSRLKRFSPRNATGG